MFLIIISINNKNNLSYYKNYRIIYTWIQLDCGFNLYTFSFLITDIHIPAVFRGESRKKTITKWIIIHGNYYDYRLFEMIVDSKFSLQVKSKCNVKCSIKWSLCFSLNFIYTYFFIFIFTYLLVFHRFKLNTTQNDTYYRYKYFLLGLSPDVNLQIMILIFFPFGLLVLNAIELYNCLWIFFSYIFRWVSKSKKKKWNKERSTKKKKILSNYSMHMQCFSTKMSCSLFLMKTDAMILFNSHFCFVVVLVSAKHRLHKSQHEWAKKKFQILHVRFCLFACFFYLQSQKPARTRIYLRLRSP